MEAKRTADELLEEAKELIGQAREIEEKIRSMSASPERDTLEALAENLIARSNRLTETATKLLK